MMAMPSPTPFPLTGNDFLDLLTNGYYWELDSTRTINWSISDGWNEEDWGSPAYYVDILTELFVRLEYYINVNFQYVGHFSDPGHAYANGSDINLSLDEYLISNIDPNITAMGLFPNIEFIQIFLGSDYYPGATGDIYFNLDNPLYKFSALPGGEVFVTAMHEVGHVLGLKHTHGNGGTGRPTAAELDLGSLDIDYVSIMSYNDNDELLGLIQLFEPQTPMGLDVLALQYIYGPNMSTNSGDSIYNLPLNKTYLSIWDAGGNDEINVSGHTQGWYIALPYDIDFDYRTQYLGYALLVSENGILFDDEADSPSNLFWLLGEIENLVGSDFDDVLIGNELENIILGESGDDVLSGFYGNDILVGGEGNDTLDGTQGIDFAIYKGNFSDYSITYDAVEEAITVSTDMNSDGSDLLLFIEYLAFEDQIISTSEFLPHHPVYGNIVITGDPSIGGVLTAEVQGLIDPDGLGNFSFQWFKNDAPIVGATSSSYQIKQLDIDSFLRVDINFTDGDNYRESISSESRLIVEGVSPEYVSLMEMYVVIAGRAPDAGGLAFWSDILDSGKEFNFIAGEMWNASQTQALYPPSMSSENKVTAIYNNVLNREPDQEGLDFWVGRWDSRGPVDTMLEMINAIKNYDGTIQSGLEAKQLFMNKLDIGAYLAITNESDDLQLASSAYDYLSYGHSVEETAGFVDHQLESLGQPSAGLGEALLA